MSNEDCDYCGYGFPLTLGYADGILANLEVHIEDGRLFMQLGNDEAVARIAHCPKCGRKL